MEKTNLIEKLSEQTDITLVITNRPNFVHHGLTVIDTWKLTDNHPITGKEKPRWVEIALGRFPRLVARDHGYMMLITEQTTDVCQKLFAQQSHDDIEVLTYSLNTPVPDDGYALTFTPHHTSANPLIFDDQDQLLYTIAEKLVQQGLFAGRDLYLYPNIPASDLWHLSVAADHYPDAAKFVGHVTLERQRKNLIGVHAVRFLGTTLEHCQDEPINPELLQNNRSEIIADLTNAVLHLGTSGSFHDLESRFDIPLNCPELRALDFTLRKHP